MGKYEALVNERTELLFEINKLEVFLSNLRAGMSVNLLKSTTYKPKNFGDGVMTIPCPRPLELIIDMRFIGERAEIGCVNVTEKDMPHIEEFVKTLAESIQKKQWRRYEEVSEKIAAVETLLNGPE